MKQKTSEKKNVITSSQDTFIPADFRWFFQGKAMRGASIEDEPLVHTVDVDNGKNRNALIILHGYSSTPSTFRHIWPNLNRFDRITIPRLPGHGRSISAFARSTASEWVAFSETCCLDLLNQYKEVEILGLSLGGLIATKLCQRLPFRHAFLLSPALNLTVNTTYLLALSKLMGLIGFSHYRSAAGDIRQPQHFDLAYRLSPVSTIKEMLHLTHTYQHQPLKCTADLLLGKYDTVVQCYDVAQRFANDNNTSIHWLENSAHILPLDGDLEYIINLVNQSPPPH